MKIAEKAKERVEIEEGQRPLYRIHVTYNRYTFWEKGTPKKKERMESEMKDGKLYVIKGDINIKSQHLSFSKPGMIEHAKEF